MTLRVCTICHLWVIFFFFFFSQAKTANSLKKTFSGATSRPQPGTIDSEMEGLLRNRTNHQNISLFSHSFVFSVNAFSASRIFIGESFSKPLFPLGTSAFGAPSLKLRGQTFHGPTIARTGESDILKTAELLGVGTDISM